MPQQQFDSSASPIDPTTLARVHAERDANVTKKAALGPGLQMAAVRTFEVPVARASGHPRSVRCRWLVPDRHAFKGGTATEETWPGVLVYLHGGGWVLGSIDTFDRLGRELAHRSGWVVCMVDYAKAPEQPFPAAVEDAWAALQWAGEHAAAELDALGTPLAPEWRLVVGGDSAGGNLAAVCARRAVTGETQALQPSDGALPPCCSGAEPDADPARVRLDGQLLIYPVTDCDLGRPSYADRPDERAGIAEFWRLYAGVEPGNPPTTEPDASPLRASTLAGQAPALVMNAEHDCLNSEIDAYARRLAVDRVTVQRHTIADCPHGVISYFDTAPAASEAIDVIADWLDALPR